MQETKTNDSIVAISLIEKGIELLKKENLILMEQNKKMARQLEQRQFMSKSSAAKFLGVSHTQIRRLIDAGKLREHNGRISKLELYRFADYSVSAIKNKTLLEESCG